MLTERQKLILEKIIQLYTKYGQPIGSKTLLSETELTFSPATIRSEMSRLEERGYLEKTHTSSGRVPSFTGYRFYIDHLMDSDFQPDRTEKPIDLASSNKFNQLDDVIQHSANVLSRLTSYTAIVLGPAAQTCRLTGFRIVPLTKSQMMAILVTDTGMTENMVFNLPSSVKASDIESMVRIFDDQLIGYTLMEVYDKLQTDIPLLIQKYATSAEGLLGIITETVHHSQKDNMHIGGKINFIDYTENIGRSKIKSIYEIIEHKNELASLLANMNRGIDIRVGQELQNELFSDFSLVTASYRVEGYGQGIVAVLGPTNMSYEKTIHLLHSFKNELSDELLKFYLSE